MNISPRVMFRAGHVGLIATMALGILPPLSRGNSRATGMPASDVGEAPPEIRPRFGEMGPPVIFSQPQSQTIASGQSVWLTVAATERGLIYQWYHGTSGDTTAPITHPTSVSAYQTGPLYWTTSYWVRVSNALGKADSNTATISVLPGILRQPASLTVTVGESATFIATAIGTTATEQWQVSADGGSTFTDLSGATTEGYSFVAAAADNGKQFRAVFTNSVGSVTSTAATLTVLSVPGCPTITLAPATLPSATLAAAYSQTITGSGGTAPYSFGVTTGALPANLTFTSAGVLSGTPTTAGTSMFSIRGTDANGCFAESSFTLLVAAPVPTLSQAFIILLALGLTGVGYIRLRRRARAPKVTGVDVVS